MIKMVAKDLKSSLQRSPDADAVRAPYCQSRYQHSLGEQALVVLSKPGILSVHYSVLLLAYLLYHIEAAR